MSWGLAPPKGGEWQCCPLAFPLARDLLFHAMHLLVAAMLCLAARRIDRGSMPAEKRCADDNDDDHGQRGQKPRHVFSFAGCHLPSTYT